MKIHLTTVHYTKIFQYFSPSWQYYLNTTHGWNNQDYWIWIFLSHRKGFLHSTTGKETACQCRRQKRCGFDPWVRKIPLEEDMATHSSILAWRIPWIEESGGQRSISCRESDMPEAREHTYSIEKVFFSPCAVPIIAFCNFIRNTVFILLVRRCLNTPSKTFYPLMNETSYIFQFYFSPFNFITMIPSKALI